MEHDVGEQVSRPPDVTFQDSSIEHSILLVGEGVEVASHTFQSVEDMPCSPPCRTFKGGMLTEVCQSFLHATALMTSAGSDAVAAIDHLRERGQVDDAQAIG